MDEHKKIEWKNREQETKIPGRKCSCIEIVFTENGKTVTTIKEVD